MTTCNSTGFEGVQCELEPGHEKHVRSDGVGSPHRSHLTDGRKVSWVDNKHCVIHGHMFTDYGRCIRCDSHRDPVYR